MSKSKYENWVEMIYNNSTIGDKEFGKYLLYLCFDNDEFIGLLNIRYDLSQKLRYKYGDIDYGVKPSKRN